MGTQIRVVGMASSTRREFIRCVVDGEIVVFLSSLISDPDLVLFLSIPPIPTNTPTFATIVLDSLLSPLVGVASELSRVY